MFTEPHYKAKLLSLNVQERVALAKNRNRLGVRLLDGDTFTISHIASSPSKVGQRQENQPLAEVVTASQKCSPFS